MNTALSAKDEVNIIFMGKEHENFFYSMLIKWDNYDVYHQALAYCLGVSEDVRRHIDRVYDRENDCVLPESLQEGWITSGSARVLRMAFNLFCNCTPSVDDSLTKEEQIKETARYAVEDLFCCSYARYFWEAIKLRYPEYCHG
jgi:hypothetical protein